MLVIDDLHELDSSEEVRCLEHLLARMPPHLRVVLTSREEPQLGLHRLRLTGELTEIRAPDLRFSPEETRELFGERDRALGGGAGLLHERTEGWAAGLRLAAMSLAGPGPRAVREISQAASARSRATWWPRYSTASRRRSELLRTSILDRVSGPLADLLTGGSGSERILHGLEEANAFVTSLDPALLVSSSACSPTSCGWSCDAPTPRASTPCGRPPPGTRNTGIQWRRFVTPRRPRIGGTPRLLTDSYISLFLDGRRATVRGLLADFPPEAATTDPELAIALRAPGCSHADRKR